MVGSQALVLAVYLTGTATHGGLQQGVLNRWYAECGSAGQHRAGLPKIQSLQRAKTVSTKATDTDDQWAEPEKSAGTDGALHSREQLAQEIVSSIAEGECRVMHNTE